jgi:phage major head subunit gpT-like protein
MIVNRANLDALFNSYSTRFADAQKAVATRAWPQQLLPADIAIIMNVTGAATNHAWLEQVKGMREWLGERVINNLKLGKLLVANRAFENTVAVSRNDIEDDQYGAFAPLMAMMGQSAEDVWDTLVAAAVAGNAAWADGNPFFCTGRVIGDSGDLSNAASTALSREAVETAIAAMLGWKLYGGDPANVTPRYLLVAPTKFADAKQIVEAEIVANGAGTAGISNVSTARMLQVRVSQKLTGDAWYLVGEKAGILPVCIQKRKLPTLTRLDRDTDECVFMRNEFLYGTEARGEAFLTLPFLAYRGGVAAAAWDSSLVPSA